MKAGTSTSTERMRQLRRRRRAAGEVERTVSAHPGDWPKIRALERACRAARARLVSGDAIRIGDYPQLRLIAWQRDPGDVVDGAEALDLYEANWRYVDSEEMTGRERTFLKRLIRMYGGGVLNV